MSSLLSITLCFICHSTVNSDIHEETREKYREVVGMHLCPDSHICHICCHVLNKLWLFKSVCLKRSLEYPVLFSEKGTINLQRNYLEINNICQEDCEHYTHRNLNSKTYEFKYLSTIFYEDFGNQHECSMESNQYMVFDDDRYVFEDFNCVENLINNNGSNTNAKSLQTDLEEVIETHTLENHKKINLNTEDFETVDNDCNISENASINESIGNNLSDNDLENEKNDDHPKTSKLENVNLKVSEQIKNLDKTNNNEKDATVDTHCLNQVTKTAIENKKKKHKKKGFKKITLSIEQQKAELEMKRKEKKYIESNYKCYNCALGFLFKDVYQAHMMRHEESNGTHVCPICSLRFASAKVYRSHVFVHSARLKCRVCSKFLVSLRAKTAHANACSGKVESQACELCGKQFKDSACLLQHVRRFHLSKLKNKIYSCSVCGKTFENAATVRSHMLSHINNKFTCDVCNSTFSSPYTLNQHRKKHQQPSEVGQHQCEICKKSYDTRKNLLAHKRTSMEHQREVFVCSICSRQCSTKKSLASHIQSIHNMSKHLTCSMCPASYSNRKSLLRHERSHSVKVEPKEVVCHLCGGKFKGINKLNKHLSKVCEKSKHEKQQSTSYYQQDAECS